MKLNIKNRLKTIKFLTGSIICIVASKLVKREDKKIAFGSWSGKLYIDNSRYLLEKALEIYDDTYSFVWVGEKDVKEQLPKDSRIIFVEKNTIDSLVQLMKCKYMFFSQFHFEDISNYNVYKGAVLTYLHHGCPIKKIVDDAISTIPKSKLSKFKNDFIRKITGSIINIDYFVNSSETHFNTNLTSLCSFGCNTNNNLRTGTPRNDFLLKSNTDTQKYYKKMYADLLRFPVEKKVILYVPTFRRSGIKNESLIKRNKEELEDLCAILDKHKCVLIEKAHFVGDFEKSDAEECYPELIKCPKNVNLQEMLTFTDCIISDYSGAFLDFSLLDRPIINYVYDYEFYRNIDSGLYYDINEFAAGPVVKNYAELLEAIDNSISNPDYMRDRRIKVKEKFMEYEKGTASEQILNIVINKEPK